MSDASNDKRKQLSEIARQLTWLGQLGLSLIMPLLLAIGACVLLNNRFDIGGWIFIPGFILGIGASFMTAYKFYLSETASSKKDAAKRKGGYNRHT